MATKGDSEGFVSSPFDGQGARHKNSYFPVIDENTAELRYTDVGEIFQGVNPQEALCQFDVSHNGDQRISQSLKWPLFTQQTWSCGLTKLKHNSIYIRLWKMTNAIDYLCCALWWGSIWCQRRVTSAFPHTQIWEFEGGFWSNEEVWLHQRESIKWFQEKNWDLTYRLDSSDGYRRQLGSEPKQWWGKAVIRQAFIRQMPTSPRAHLATQPDFGKFGHVSRPCRRCRKRRRRS